MGWAVFWQTRRGIPGIFFVSFDSFIFIRVSINSIDQTLSDPGVPDLPIQIVR